MGILLFEFHQKKKAKIKNVTLPQDNYPGALCPCIQLENVAIDISYKIKQKLIEYVENFYFYDFSNTRLCRFVQAHLSLVYHGSAGC